MRDRATVKEIFEYEGNISQICRWAQKILGYQFTIVYRSYKMIMNVDALFRRFGPLIALHCSIANIFHGMDIKNRPDAYDEHTFMRDGQTKVKIRESDNKIILPTIIKSIVNNEKYVPCTEDRAIIHLSPSLIISSFPVLVTSTHQPVNTRDSSKETLFRILAIQESLSINCLCIDDICESLFEWCKNNESRNIQWNTSSIFTRRYTSLIFESLNKNIPYDIVPIKKIQAWVVTSMPHVNLFEATFVPGNRTTMLE